MKIIPNEDALINSIIHKKFHKKSRKWEFTRHILLYSTEEDIQVFMDRIQHLGPKFLNRIPEITYLNEKKIAMGAFTKAKKAL